jgi:hypothetical protein
MRLEAPLNSVNTHRKPLPARRSQRYFGGGGYDADRQDSGQVAGANSRHSVLLTYAALAP